MTTIKVKSKKESTLSISSPKKKTTLGGNYAIGRRKESVARVYYFVSPNFEITINNRPFEEYFPHTLYSNIIIQPLELANRKKGKWKIIVVGGGKRGQAESIRLGISRILVSLDETIRPIIKKAGYLKRDPRVKERKKYGLKRARRAPQWAKR